MILLPPSEGKTPPTSGPALDLDSLSFPELRQVRDEVFTALVDLCRGDADRAMATLGLGPRQAAEVTVNADLPTAACGPAGSVYTGVLYDALGADLATDPRVVIASALFGVVRGNDLIPPYRLPPSARLPGLHATNRLWRAPLSAALTPTPGLVVDLRSGAYSSRYPGRDHGWATVRVVMDRGGRRVSVSHHNKRSKGLLTRDLLSSGANPGTTADLVATLRDLGWDATQPSSAQVEVVARG